MLTYADDECKGEKRLRLLPEKRREAFELCHECMLEYRSKGLWDNADLVLAIHRYLKLLVYEA
jgi:hypothetical protein